MYSTNGTFLNQTFPMVDLTSNTAILKKNQTMDYATQAFFRQAAGKLNDSIADPDVSIFIINTKAFSALSYDVFYFSYLYL